MTYCVTSSKLRKLLHKLQCHYLCYSCHERKKTVFNKKKSRKRQVYTFRSRADQMAIPGTKSYQHVAALAGIIIIIYLY